MSDTVLKVENLYKRYRLGTVGAASFGEDLQRLWAKMRGKPDPFERYVTANELSAVKTPEEMKALKARYVWALQDINFEVKQGEIVGIIGKNGAGKSTLLKILSKTTAPTRGQVKIKGRVASLLEVGTGFHPELTGRENIYLNGHILGMTRHEIRARLDEIIDFAGIEAYLDTPVKRYSSGMYVRLAFAVAAHLLADILIVDEVLAVGDAEFQKKCIGKMQDVSKGEGRTVLFVSHNMAAVKALCNSGIYLKNGLLDYCSSIDNVIDKYLSIDNSSLNAINTFGLNHKLQDAYFTEVKVTQNKVISDNIDITEDFYIEISYVVLTKINGLVLSFSLYTIDGIMVFYCPNLNTKSEVGDYTSIVCIPKKFLAPNTYYINIGLSIPMIQLFDIKESPVKFKIVDTGTNHFQYNGQNLGLILVEKDWQTIKNN